MLTSAKKIAGDHKTSVLGRAPDRSVSPVMKGIWFQAGFSKRIIDRYSGTLNYQFDPATLVLLMQLQEQEQMYAQKKKTYHLTWNLISYLIEAGNGKEMSASRKEVEQEVRRQLKSMEQEPGREYERLREYFHVYQTGQNPNREQLWQSAESRRFVENQEQKEEEARKAGSAPLSMSASFFQNMDHLFRGNRLPDYKEIFHKANQSGLEKYYLSVYMQAFAKEPDEVKREQMVGDILRDFQPSMVLEYLETEGNAKAGLFMKAVKRLNGGHEEDTAQTQIEDNGKGDGRISLEITQVSEFAGEIVPELFNELSTDFQAFTRSTEIREKIEKLLGQEIQKQTENKLRESAWKQLEERVKELPGQDPRVQEALLSVLREQFMQREELRGEKQEFYEEPGNLENPFYEGIQLILKEAAGQNGEGWNREAQEPERYEAPSEGYKKNWKRMEQILEETVKKQEQEEKFLEEHITKELDKKSVENQEEWRKESGRESEEAPGKENGRGSGEVLEQRLIARIQEKIGERIDRKLEENRIYQERFSGKEISQTEQRAFWQEPLKYFLTEPVGNVVWEKTEQLLQKNMESEEFSNLWRNLEEHREEILQTLFHEQIMETSRGGKRSNILENKELPEGGKKTETEETKTEETKTEKTKTEKTKTEETGRTEPIDLDAFLLKEEDQQMAERYRKVSVSVQEILSHADEISKNTLVERVEEFKENFYQQIEELVYREGPEEETEEELFSRKELRMLLEEHKRQEAQREDSFHQMLREQGRRLSERYAGSMPGITMEENRKPEQRKKEPDSELGQENQPAGELTVQKTVKQEVVSFLQNKLELYAYTQLARAFEQEPQPYLSTELLRQIKKAGNGLDFLRDSIKTSVGQRVSAGGAEDIPEPGENAFLKFLQGESAEPLLKTVSLPERKLLYLSLAHGADGLIVREQMRERPELWKEILQFKEQLVKDGDYSRMIQGDFRFLKQNKRKEELAQAYQALSEEGRSLLEAGAREELLLLSKTVTGKEEPVQAVQSPVFYGTSQSGQMPDSRKLWESMGRMRKELLQEEDTIALEKSDGYHSAESELASYFSKTELMLLLRPETKEKDAAREKISFREREGGEFLENKGYTENYFQNTPRNSTGIYLGRNLLSGENLRGKAEPVGYLQPERNPLPWENPEARNSVLNYEGRLLFLNEPLRRQMLQTMRQVSLREKGRWERFPGEMYSHLLMQEDRGEIRPVENLPANEVDFLQRRGNYDRIRQIKKEQELQKQVVLEERIQMIFREQQKDTAAKMKPSEEESKEFQETIQRVQELDMSLLEYRGLLGEKDEQMEELSRRLSEQEKTLKKLQGKKEEQKLYLESEAPMEEWMDKLKKELILEQMRNGRL